MAKFLKKIKKMFLGKQDTETVMSSVKSFNQASSAYLDLLETNITNKKQDISKIRAFLKGKIPSETSNTSQIDIQLIDINNTQVKRRGKGKQTERMEWEKELQKFNNTNRGTLI